jgi:hypothetical protein
MNIFLTSAFASLKYLFNFKSNGTSHAVFPSDLKNYFSFT